MSLEVLCLWCFDVSFSFSNALFPTLLGSIMICVDSQLNNKGLENDAVGADESPFICWAKPIYVGPIKNRYIECVLLKLRIGFIDLFVGIS